jgi:tRNA-dihydrouridine synthase
MIGRGAIGRPSVFAEIKVGLGWIKQEDLPWVDDNWFAGDESARIFQTRKWCWNRYIELANATTGLRPKWMMRHAVAFTKGLPGAKKVRMMMHSHTKPEEFADSVSNYLAQGCSEG